MNGEKAVELILLAWVLGVGTGSIFTIVIQNTFKKSK